MVSNGIQLITCEHDNCSEQLSHEEAHSCVVVLQKVDKQGYTYHQCEQGQEINFMNYQHWHCSHEHMQAYLLTCVNEHYSEEELHPPIAGTTILHKIVLGSNLTCKACGKSLTEQAYRFCLTQATPVNAIPDDSHSETGEWCCSLSCAKQSVVKTIQAMEEVNKGA